jgi:hypothetical protein
MFSLTTHSFVRRLHLDLHLCRSVFIVKKLNASRSDLANGVSRMKKPRTLHSFFPRSYFAPPSPFIESFHNDTSPIMEKPWRTFGREEEWKYGV